MSTAVAELAGRAPYAYRWPQADSLSPHDWTVEPDGRFLTRALPESREALARDSRWPAMFPSPVALVTAGDGSQAVLERVVGPSIVNRFPYVLALSVCREPLSERHYVRDALSAALESSRTASVQFLAPGPALDRVLDVIGDTSDGAARIARSGLATRGAPAVFDDAYLVYSGRLLEETSDAPPWRDVGSHRVYFLEISRIELREDIALGASQVHWRSLPSWTPAHDDAQRRPPDWRTLPEGRYRKGYTPDYRFPAAGTVAFEYDEVVDGMAVKHLPTGRRAAEQVETDNDRARWPCFFPSSVGMITTWARDGVPNLMPCGSTTVVSRHPLVIAPSVSYAAVNERYAPRHTIEILRRTRRFGCGVPFLDEALVDSLAYAGNISLTDNVHKVRDAGLPVEARAWAPQLTALPVHYECEVVGEQELGTHAMIYGEVRRIYVRADLSAANPLQWFPYADVLEADA